MKAEFNRSIFTKRKRYKSLEMQQGLVQLDVDWSEKLDLQLHDEVTYLEVWGRDVRATEDNSSSDTVNAEGPDTTPRVNRSGRERPCLRLTKEVGKGLPTTTVEAALGSVPSASGLTLGLPTLEIAVDGSLWQLVASLSASGPEDRVFTLKQDGDRIVIEFGDGKNGARPPAGSAVVARYRFGGGGIGNVA